MRGWRFAQWALWLGAGMMIGSTVSTAVAIEHIDTLYRKLEVLAEVFGQIENQYVDPISPADLIYGAADGAVRRLDGHSAFFTPDEYQELINVTEGEYVGVGVEVSFRGNSPEVVAVIDDSPAGRAGLTSGDRILAIDGESTEGMHLEAIQKRLHGPVGSKVVLNVKHLQREEALALTLVRSWIRVVPIEATSLAPGVEYVRIKTFARRVAFDLETQLSRRQPEKGLILDLRDNPGGLFDEALAVCDLFLSGGSIVSAMGRGGRLIETHAAHSRGTQPGYPMAILIDEGSASAAEIVAGALKDRGRARLFGTRSYGKGSVQTIIGLSDGSGLKLTVARYLTPSGTRIDHHGVQPDEVIEAGDGDVDRVVEIARKWLET